jgi:hypothetical protein
MPYENIVAPILLILVLFAFLVKFVTRAWRRFYSLENRVEGIPYLLIGLFLLGGMLFIFCVVMLILTMLGYRF